MTGIDSDGEGLASALRRFPTHAAQIRDLIRRNESFRTICEDLACAERALLFVNHLDEGIREARRQEFTEMVDDLSIEVERLLSQTKITTMSDWLAKPR